MIQEQTRLTLARMGVTLEDACNMHSFPYGIYFLLNADGEWGSKQKMRALLRAQLLCREALEERHILFWRFQTESEEETQEVLQRFAGTVSPALPAAKEFVCMQQDGEAFLEARLYWDLRWQKISMEKLFSQILEADHGGMVPELTSGQVFLIDMQKDMLFYLYDDRGADVFAAKPSALRDLYREYTSWLHPHNWEQERMRQMFCAEEK